MDEEKGVRCPECGGWLIKKNGKTKAGKQKYRCVSDPVCGRQFTVGSRILGKGKLALVFKLLAQNIAPPKIKKAVPGISLRWIYELRNRVGSTAAAHRRGTA